jgi:hypothetical protein
LRRALQGGRGLSLAPCVFTKDYKRNL